MNALTAKAALIFILALLMGWGAAATAYRLDGDGSASAADRSRCSDGARGDYLNRDPRVPGRWQPLRRRPGRGAGPAVRQLFEGRLRLVAERPEGGFQVLTDRYGDAKSHGGAALHLPDFDFQFVQADDALIPVKRGSIASAHPEWEFILEPGRVWEQPGDGGFARAAIPFALEERNANCMHHGVLTFMFRADGSTSDVAFKIAAETCAYFQFNLWGYARAQYLPEPVAGRDVIIARYRDEVRTRMPARPLAALASALPGARPEAFASPQEIPARSLSTAGLIVDGVQYSAGSPHVLASIRIAKFSTCRRIRWRKRWSVRLGSCACRSCIPNSPARRSPTTCRSVRGPGGWPGVTVLDALDMATGRYLSADYEHDEDADMLPFFRPQSPRQAAFRVHALSSPYAARDPMGVPHD